MEREKESINTSKKLTRKKKLLKHNGEEKNSLFDPAFVPTEIYISQSGTRLTLVQTYGICHIVGVTNLKSGQMTQTTYGIGLNVLKLLTRADVLLAAKLDGDLTNKVVLGSKLKF